MLKGRKWWSRLPLSLLLCYFPHWATGSGSSREDFAEGGIVTRSGKHVRLALCPLPDCSLYSSTLEIDNNILLLFSTLNQLGTSCLDSTLVLREKCASLLFSGAFFPGSFLCCPVSWNSEVEKRDLKWGAFNLKEGQRPVRSLFRREGLFPQALRMLANNSSWSLKALSKLQSSPWGLKRPAGAQLLWPNPVS